MDTAVINSSTAVFGAGGINVNAMRPYIDGKGRSCVLSANGKDVLKANAPATLRYDQWKDLDQTVIKVGTDRLVAVADLIAAGLTHNVGGVGKTISQWDRQSDMTGATVNMDGISRAELDRLNFDTAGVPIPVIMRPYQISWRALAASQSGGGEALDTSTAGVASRLVAEAMESMLFVGASVQVDSLTVRGYTNHPDRNTVDLAEVWDNLATTGQDIYEDVQMMIAAMHADRKWGPFHIYIPTSYGPVLDNDFAPGSGDTRTIRQRIMQIEAIKAIVVADKLPVNTVIMVQMTSDVVDWAEAQGIVNVEWEGMGGLQKYFSVMAVGAPRVKSDYDGRSGVVHLRPA